MSLTLTQPSFVANWTCALEHVTVSMHYLGTGYTLGSIFTWTIETRLGICFIRFTIFDFTHGIAMIVIEVIYCIDD